MFFHKLNPALALLLSLVALPSQAQTQVDPRAPAALDACWRDLASTEDARVSRALLAFAAQGKDATAYFKAHLRPVKVDADHVKKLVAQLEDTKFGVREAVSRKLAEEVEYVGKPVSPLLEQCLKSDLSLEAKRRIEAALKQLPAEKTEAKPAMPPQGFPGLMGKSVSVSNVNGQIKIYIDGQLFDPSAMVPPVVVPPRPNTQRLRAVRAVVLLESFATPEARALLETLATGESDALPTVEAKAALQRLTK